MNEFGEYFRSVKEAGLGVTVHIAEVGYSLCTRENLLAGSGLLCRL